MIQARRTRFYLRFYDHPKTSFMVSVRQKSVLAGESESDLGIPAFCSTVAYAVCNFIAMNGGKASYGLLEQRPGDSADFFFEGFHSQRGNGTLFL
jgi:hypothetical protein